MSINVNGLATSAARFIDNELPALAREAIAQWRIANAISYMTALDGWSSEVQVAARQRVVNLIGRDDLDLR